MNTLQNPQLQLAYDYVQYTGTNIFLTGKAGTGKTTFLHNLKKSSPKRMIVVAPTGVAAINAGGVTIHSFFQLPLGPNIPVQNNAMYNESIKKNTRFRYSGEKINIMKSLDLLVIDEISMVRADILDAVDEVLRRFRDRSKPFGGVQLLMIGDLQQLAPIVRDEEWEILRNYYKTEFFFGSRALNETNYVTIELKHVYRQSDKDFIDLLNLIRESRISDIVLNKINQRYIREFSPDPDEGFITLTTHNAQAQAINESRLSGLKEKKFSFTAEVEGEFPEYSYPTDSTLALKKGAQVMFIKNDLSPEKKYYNGKIGKITAIGDETIYIKCPGDWEVIAAGKVVWENAKYRINEETKEIETTIAGTFTQFPLKLAWAITIHKSQGLTFDKVIIDAGAAFAFGQVYVALSRCRTLEGIVLRSPIQKKGIIANEKISDFVNEIGKKPLTNRQLEESKTEFQKSLLFELFDFRNMQFPVFQLMKILKENSTVVFGNISGQIPEIQESLKTEIIEVSDKFQNQLNQLLFQNNNVEKNEILNERINKASVYFEEKLNKIAGAVEKINFETDNKTVKKQIKTSINTFITNIYTKLNCLKACHEGFTVSVYLNVRAKGILEVEKPVPHREKHEDIPHEGPVPHPILYKWIKKWRSQKAKELGLPAYMILPEKTIIQLVTYLPVTQVNLMEIKGFGKKKINSFGDEIIGLIKNYNEGAGTEISETEDMEEDQIVGNEYIEGKKPAKISTKQISFDLYQSGKTIGEIATERNMAASTISSHIAEFVGNGILKIEDILPAEKIELISEYFLKYNDTKLTPAKEALGEMVTYEELRFVLKHLQFTGRIPS